jgi:hypothetical protein
MLGSMIKTEALTVDPEQDPDVPALLKEAMRRALSEEDLEGLKRQQVDLVTQFLRGEMSLIEYNARAIPLEEYPGVIQTKYITCFRGMLEAYGLTPDMINEILSHENEHMVEALQGSLEGAYRMEFMKTETGDYAFYPSISVILPESLTDEQAREKLRSIIGAPGDMSPHDEAMLKSQ